MRSSTINAIHSALMDLDKNGLNVISIVLSEGSYQRLVDESGNIELRGCYFPISFQTSCGIVTVESEVAQKPLSNHEKATDDAWERNR